MDAVASNLIDHFSIVPDSRLDRQRKHKLIDIIVISVCGVVSGCNSFVDIADYGRSKYGWLKKFLELPNGIPSHDTFGRVLSLVDALELQRAFYSWTQSIVDLEGENIHIDGKYIKSSHGATKNKSSIFGMVNAWASEAGVALAQIRTDYEKTDEIQAFRQMITFLNLKGCVVTMDASGCHSTVTNLVIQKDADFLVALKKNQKGILRQVQPLFEEESLCEQEAVDTDKGHGRLEKRSCRSLNLDEDFLDRLANKNKKRGEVAWKGLRSVCEIKTERTYKGKTTLETRYYLSSLEADARKMLIYARSHWEVENKLHWVLDVAFREDQCRVRKGYAGENFAVIRQLAINLLKQEKTCGRSINGKRLKAAWENDYLYQVITGIKEENLVN